MKVTKADILEKKQDLAVEYVPYERPLADAIDKLLQLTKQAGYSGKVETEKHWEIVGLIFKMWQDLYPDEYEHFAKNQKWNKHNQKNKHASNREKGGAEIRHLVEIPLKFYQLIKAIFPNQTFDKAFSVKLGRKLPALRWADKV